MPKRVRPARLAEAAQQGFLGGFDEYKCRGHVTVNLLVERREALELLALARVHHKRGAIDIGGAVNVQLAKHGNQLHGKIVDAVVAEILEGLEHGALAEPLSPVRMTSWRVSGATRRFTGRRLSLDPALVGAGDAQIFAILGDGAARDADAAVGQHLGDVIVGERVRAVFLIDHFLDQPLERRQGHSRALGPFTDSLKNERSSITPCGVCAYLLETARLTVEGWTPTSSATSLIIMGLSWSAPYSRKSGWRRMITWQTRRIVFLRCSMLFINCSAAVKRSLT